MKKGGPNIAEEAAKLRQAGANDKTRGVNPTALNSKPASTGGGTGLQRVPPKGPTRRK